jgi:hypothetical protein
VPDRLAGLVLAWLDEVAVSGSAARS